MKDEFITVPLIKNETKRRFEIEIDGHIAFIDYKDYGSQIALVHTEVPELLGGRGVAAALVEKTFNYLKEQNQLLLPFCPYVFAYLKKHPEWKYMVSKKFNGYHQL